MAAGQGVARRHADDQESQVEAHLAGRAVQFGGKDEGRRRDEGVDRRGGAAAPKGEPRELDRRQQIAIAAQQYTRAE